MNAHPVFVLSVAGAVSAAPIVAKADPKHLDTEDRRDRLEEVGARLPSTITTSSVSVVQLDATLGSLAMALPLVLIFRAPKV